jgi:hypothetical protein
MHASQVLLVLLLVLGFALYKHRRRSKESLVAFMKSEIPLAIEVWMKSQVSVLPALLGARVSVPPTGVYRAVGHRQRWVFRVGHLPQSPEAMGRAWP